MGTSRGSLHSDVAVGFSKVNIGTFLNTQTDDWSIMGWFRGNSLITDYGMMFGCTTGSVSWHPTEKARSFFSTETLGTTTLSFDEWYFYTHVHPGGANTVQELFLNGVSEQTSVAITTTDMTPTAYIGGYSGTAWTYRGELAHFHAYNEVVDVPKITELMWRPFSIPENSYQYIPGWDGDSIEYDRSGHGRNGTHEGDMENSSEGPPVWI